MFQRIERRTLRKYPAGKYAPRRSYHGAAHLRRRIVDLEIGCGLPCLPRRRRLARADADRERGEAQRLARMNGKLLRLPVALIERRKMDDTLGHRRDGG